MTKIKIEDQITFITAEYDASMELSTMEENSHHYLKDMDMYSAILKNLRLLQSNDLVLQRNCLHCKASFTTTNRKQQFCSTNCRVAYYRAKNRLKEFTASVNKILSEKGVDPKFAVGVLIVPGKDCPYEVEYKGAIYKGKSTREILTKLRKI
jgi:predicted nucleic acid-binding Zn ribbon protein